MNDDAVWQWLCVNAVVEVACFAGYSEAVACRGCLCSCGCRDMRGWLYTEKVVRLAAMRLNDPAVLPLMMRCSCLCHAHLYN